MGKTERTDEKIPGFKTTRLIWVLLLAVLVYAGLSITADWADLSEALSAIQWGYLPVILLLASTNYLIRFSKWHYYTRHLGFRVTARNNLIIFLAGLVMSVTPGKMGEVLKSYLLKLVDRTPMSRSAPVVFAERLTDLIALMILAVIGGYALSGARATLAAGAVLVSCIVAVISSERLHSVILDRLARIGRLRTVACKAETSLESAKSLVEPKPLLLTSAVSIPAWFCECLGFWLILKAAGVTGLGIGQATGIYALAAVIGALSMLPGGLGATEITITGLLTASGVPKAQAVASMLVIRAATLWYAVVVGAIFLAVFRLRVSQLRQTEQQVEGVEHA